MLESRVKNAMVPPCPKYPSGNGPEILLVDVQVAWALIQIKENPIFQVTIFIKEIIYRVYIIFNYFLTV